MKQTHHKELPLIVDLDGTLLASDTLFETFTHNLFTKPFQTLAACVQLTKGRSAFKHSIAKLDAIEIENIPRNEDFVAFLETEKANGRDIHLVTAADQSIASQVLDETDLFPSAQGSTETVNLKSERKAEYLKETYPDGFVYAGDSEADLPVWRAARAAITVGVSRSVASSLTAQPTQIEKDFSRQGERGRWQAWLKALRLHQWSKNILLFVPLFLSHNYNDPSLILKTILGFLLMGLVASGTYVLNDLSDLSADRRHATKRHRPFASGALPIHHGLIGGSLLIAFGLGAAFFLDLWFGIAVAAYLVATLSYSMRFKRVALLDVSLLSLLYSLRVLMGCFLVATYVSPWLIAFSLFFFYSMSLAKRHTELIRSTAAPEDFIPGRGYKKSDWPLTLNLGASSAVAAIVVIVLYLSEEAFPSGAYQSPNYLWAAPVLMVLWVQRIWLLTQRGELDDDPVAFAIRDKISITLGIILAAFFAAAVWL